MHDGPTTFRFELSGDLAGMEVGKLDQAWRTASSTFDGKVLAVDITFLSGVDQKGCDLLRRWSNAGAHLIANSETSRRLVESVTGHAYASSDPAVGPTFEPRFTSVRLSHGGRRPDLHDGAIVSVHRIGGQIGRCQRSSGTIQCGALGQGTGHGDSGR